MNRTLIFGIALFFALVGLALIGPERTAVAGHGGCSGCKGAHARKCGGRRCDGRKARRCSGRKARRCSGCSGKGGKVEAAAPADAPEPPPAAPAPPAPAGA